MKKSLYALMPLLFLLGCGNSNSGGVKNAKGETPVKYVICGLGEKDCFVSARFKDLDSCQTHNNWAEMLCDSQSNPGTMVCTTKSKSDPVIAVAYCTL